MTRLVSVPFRGGQVDVVVDKDGGYEPDTNAHEIEWHFYGLDGAAHDALAITDKEEQAIYAALAERNYDDSD